MKGQGRIVTIISTCLTFAAQFVHQFDLAPQTTFLLTDIILVLVVGALIAAFSAAKLSLFPNEGFFTYGTLHEL